MRTLTHYDVLPEFGELCRDLSDLAYKWHSLGVFLGLDTDQLSKIQENYGGTGSSDKVNNYFMSVLSEWREGDPEEFNKEMLVEALKLISYSQLAEDVKMHAPGMADYGGLRCCLEITWLRSMAPLWSFF